MPPARPGLRPRFVNLLHHIILVRFQQADMGVGVVANLVALRLHPAQKFLVAGDLLPDYKKRCQAGTLYARPDRVRGLS